MIIRTLPGMITATLGFTMLMAAGATSYRIARRRMKHETWWVVHLYHLPAVALSFSHQIATGASRFVADPIAKAWWTALLLGTAGVVLVYRVGLPLWRAAPTTT